MPRKYIRNTGNRKYREYTTESVNKAVTEVRGGKLIYSVAKKYDMPYKSLANKVNGMHSKVIGGQMRLTDDCEHILVQTLKTLTEWKFPLSQEEIRKLVKSYLDGRGSHGVFKYNYPGPDWVRTFMKRHKLAKKVADNVKRSRTSVTAESINSYFDHLLRYLP